MLEALLKYENVVKVTYVILCSGYGCVLTFLDDTTKSFEAPDLTQATALALSWAVQEYTS